MSLTVVDEESLKAIGQVIIEFGKLEATADTAIIWLIKLDLLRGRSVAQHMDTLERRLNFIKDLSERLFPDEEMKKAFAVARKKIDNVKQRRNDLMHSWITPVNMSPSDESPPKIALAKFSRALKKIGDQSGLHLLSAKEMTQLALDIDDANTAFILFSGKLMKKAVGP